MTLTQVENAQRVDAASWAVANGLVFVWDNSTVKRVHDQPTLVWLFNTDTSEPLTTASLEHRGAVNASIYMPAGSGAVEAITLAESLAELFRGRVYQGSEILDEIAITMRGREGASYRVDVQIPWTYREDRIPQGAIGLYETPGALVAYQAVRQLWETRVRAPLSLKTYFDNTPSAVPSPPFAIARFRTLQPIPVELGTLRVNGRLLVALHDNLGDGLAFAEEAITTMVGAFSECMHRGVFFGTPLVNRIGRTPNNTWQANVRLPFYYEVRT